MFIIFERVSSATEQQEEEPEWVEVMVDMLLSLLSQQSRHIRQVCKAVFSSICPHVTAAALTAILDVSHRNATDWPTFDVKLLSSRYRRAIWIVHNI